MPHLSIQYSANLEDEYDMTALCDALNDAIDETGLFPLAGTRVRAFRADHASIADKDPRNAFVAMQAYIGEGRTLEEQQGAGSHIMKATEAFFAKRLAEPHFALSFEIFENKKALSWKTNAMTARLHGGK